MTRRTSSNDHTNHDSYAATDNSDKRKKNNTNKHKNHNTQKTKHSNNNMQNNNDKAEKTRLTTKAILKTILTIINRTTWTILARRGIMIMRINQWSFHMHDWEWEHLITRDGRTTKQSEIKKRRNTYKTHIIIGRHVRQTIARITTKHNNNTAKKKPVSTLIRIVLIIRRLIMRRRATCNTTKKTQQWH